jgi:hypothetical protein
MARKTLLKIRLSADLFFQALARASKRPMMVRLRLLDFPLHIIQRGDNRQI